MASNNFSHSYGTELGIPPNPLMFIDPSKLFSGAESYVEAIKFRDKMVNLLRSRNLYDYIEKSLEVLLPLRHLYSREPAE